MMPLLLVGCVTTATTEENEPPIRELDIYMMSHGIY